MMKLVSVLITISLTIFSLPSSNSAPRCQINGNLNCATVDEWRFNLLCRGLGATDTQNAGANRANNGYIHDALQPGNNGLAMKIRRSAVILLNNMGEELITIWAQLTTDAQRLAYLRKWETIVNTVGTQLYGPAGNWNSAFTCGLNANQPTVQCGDRANAGTDCDAVTSYALPAYGYSNPVALEDIDQFALSMLNGTNADQDFNEV